MNKIPLCNFNCVINSSLFNCCIMSVKRVFGSILTVLGIVSLIYAAILFANSATNNHDIKVVIIYSVLGLIFFVSGVSLIRTVKNNL